MIEISRQRRKRAISVKLEEHQYLWLVMTADRVGATKSEVVRVLLDAAVKTSAHPGGPNEKV